MTADLLAAYRPLAGSYDEMVGADGHLRDHWAPVGRALDDLDVDELARRRREVIRLLDDDGVTYNVYGTHGGRGQRWALDPLPLLVSKEEWAGIDRGVVQRAELLNRILADLYGPRDLIRRGLLPPELVYAHPGFLRACDGIRIPGDRQLFTCATDLARDGDGRAVVLADRTQAPSGAGYALENRVVVSRVFAGLYRDAQVHRLAPFFRALRATLQRVAPAGAGDPRIVVMTPGSLSETAFEHAFLASYLGYPLVEAADLTVREGKVWLRSLGRLEPIHVILRRVDSWFCDPLELRPDSHLGVPGLVEACRIGAVSVVNTLGSGVLENPGLTPFLPSLCEALLGESLHLDSVATWWCGDPTSRRHVLSRLANLIVKPIGRGDPTGGSPSARDETGSVAVLGWELDEAQRDDLRRRIEARPYAFVGQEPLALASVPTVTDAGLESRRTVLRTFVVAGADGYEALPGGLTRVAGADDDGMISNQAGALSKDTWVLSSEPEAITSYWLHTGPAVVAVEPEASMSARAAENLFWLGRYAERAEDVVRLVRVVQDRRNDFQHGSNPAGTRCLHALLGALTRVTTTWPGFAGDGPENDGGVRAGEGAGDDAGDDHALAALLADPGPELGSLVLDDERPGTVAYAVRRLLDASYAVRDQLSMDTWLVVGALDRELLDIDRRRPDRPAFIQGTLSRVLQSLLALSGLAAESFVRDPGWRFMDVGRRIERAMQLAALLRATVTVERDNATDSLLLESVLTASESIITYRRRYRSQAQMETLLDLMLLDPDNPRSLAYQFDRLAEDMAALPGSGVPGKLSEAERAVLETSTILRLADTARLAGFEPSGITGVSGQAGDQRHRVELEAFLGKLLGLLARAADAVAAEHFTPPVPQHMLMAPADAGLPGEIRLVFA